MIYQVIYTYIFQVVVVKIQYLYSKNNFGDRGVTKGDSW